MIESESSENAEDTVTFVNTFRVEPSKVRHMMPAQFVTVYKHALINWHIQISESGGMPAFLRDLMEPGNRDFVYQVTLNPAGQRENHPPVLSIDFKIRVIDANDKDIIAPVRFVHPPGFPIRSVFNAGYSTPERGHVKDWLSTVIGHKHFENYKIEILTTIVFDVNTLLGMQYLNRSVGKPMPIDLNFRFNLLTNSNTHDFYLKTRSGLQYPCNKEALYVASLYFRKNLTCEMSSFHLLEVELLESIEVVITWLLTETYHPPSEMTPELAREIVILAERLVPRGPNQRKLAGSVERHCFEELIKNHEDMNYVKRLLLISHVYRLGSLLESCHAIMISYHFSDLCREMEKNLNLDFHNTVGMHGSSAWKRLLENYSRSLLVKCYTRKIPTTASAQSI